MTREELEEKKKLFRLEQMERRQAAAARRAELAQSDSSAFMRQQLEQQMHEAFASGDVDMFAEKYLRLGLGQPDEPSAPAELKVPTAASIAKSAAVRARLRLRLRPARPALADARPPRSRRCRTRSLC